LTGAAGTLPTPMQAVLQALLALQEIDRDIFRAQSELRRLPAERAGRKVEIDKRLARLSEMHERVKVLRVRIKEIEDLTTTQRQRVRKVDNEAAGSRNDMALLAAFQHQIKTLKREISAAEEEGLGLVEEAETLEKDAAALTSEAEAEQRIFDEFAGNVEREIATAQGKLAELQSLRGQRMAADIPSEALALYTRILSARGGVATAELDGRICQACYMQIPVNLVVRIQRRTELVQCPSCDRILFLPA
jgi:predicted  nucleic acid-binding Zn-ribbon protein